MNKVTSPLQGNCKIQKKITGATATGATPVSPENKDARRVNIKLSAGTCSQNKGGKRDACWIKLVKVISFCPHHHRSSIDFVGTRFTPVQSLQSEY